MKRIKRDIVINWKTTAAAIGAFLAIAMPQFGMWTDGDPLTNPDWNILIAAVGVLLTGVFARDADKSSQDSGVRP